MFAYQSVVILVEFINHPTQPMPMWFHCFIFLWWSRFPILIEVVDDSFPKTLFILRVTHNAAIWNCEPSTYKHLVIIHTPWNAFTVRFFHRLICEIYIFYPMLCWIRWKLRIRNWLCWCCINLLTGEIKILLYLRRSRWTSTTHTKVIIPRCIVISHRRIKIIRWRIHENLICKMWWILKIWWMIGFG